MRKTLKSWLKNIKLHESQISMVLGALVVVVLSVLAYNYFTSDTTDEQKKDEKKTQEYILEIKEEDGKLVPQELPRQHIVSKGEHLWSISEKYYGNGYNWLDISQANNISNPNLLVEGQELQIPKVELRVTSQIPELGQDSTSETIDAETYQVKKGDTLWGIAVRAYQDGYQWPDIFQANRGKISDPDIIEVGSEIVIPR